MNRDALPMREGLPVWRAMEIIEQRTADHFAVVAADGEEFVGMVSRRDIVSAYLSVSRSVRREQNEIV
jgi:CBS domain-containing protein